MDDAVICFKSWCCGFYLARHQFYYSNKKYYIVNTEQLFYFIICLFSISFSLVCRENFLIFIFSPVKLDLLLIGDNVTCLS